MPVEAVGIDSSTTITSEEVVRDMEQTGTQNMNDDETRRLAAAPPLS